MVMGNELVKAAESWDFGTVNKAFGDLLKRVFKCLCCARKERNGNN